jgi:Ca-activated chloride channel family protein
MHIQTDRALVPSGAPAVRYLQVIVSAPPGRAAAPARPPVEVALVLDRSGSMDGTKIAMARKAVDHAIRLLKPIDRLAVVCYDEHVDTVLSRAEATAEAKTLALTRLAAIDARGSTDLAGGWTRGADEIRGGSAT